jgi:uncharacterized iron-regulated protein
MLQPIGAPGTVKAGPGEIVRTEDGRRTTVEDVAAAADGHRFVYLGESHDVLAHHEMQAAVIEALAKRGRDVVVGFEMFTRPVQGQLNPWTLGWWTEAEFVEKADWKGQWGFDFALYRPIFEAVRKNRLPMVALNVPRDWVRRVGREGVKALNAEEQAQFPALDVTNQDHRAVFNAMMGGHPPTGDRGENIYSAQVLWDTAMADSALKYLAARPATRQTVFVVVAGSGHVMYGQGINYRIWKRTGEKGLTLVMTESEGAVEVSRGIADYVFNSRQTKATGPSERDGKRGRSSSLVHVEASRSLSRAG